MKRSKNWIILGIVLLFLSISIGYAFLTKRLEINGITNIKKSTWDVHFENAKELGGSVSATEDLTINKEKDTVTFDVLLKKPGDYYEFQVDIVNDGTIDAMLEEVIKTGVDITNEKYINFNIKYEDGQVVGKYDKLEANTRKTIIVRVEYKDISNAEDLPKDEFHLNLGLQFSYTQADKKGDNNEINIEEVALLEEVQWNNGSWFWGSGKSRSEVKTITLEDSINIPENAVYIEDISAAKDGRVMAYFLMNEEDNTKYDLYINGKGKIYANPNSYYTFANFSNVTEINGMNKFDTSLIENMEEMFKETKNIETMDTSTWNLSKVTNMNRTFLSLSQEFDKLKYLDASNWGLNKVETMEETFYGRGSLTSLGDTSNWDLSNVINMKKTFMYSSIENLDTSNWGLENVETMERTFEMAKKLISLGDTSSWNLSKVKNLKNTFYYCEKLQSLNTTNWNLQNVETMEATFYYNLSLKSLGNTANWNLANVTNMHYTFGWNHLLEEIQVTNWDTSHVTNFYYTFYQCYNLNIIDLGQLNFINATNMNALFAECHKLNGTINFNGAYASNNNVFNMINHNNGEQIIINYTEETESIVDLWINKAAHDQYSTTNLVKGTLIV